LFQVMLAHQPAEAGAFEFAGLEASVEAVSTSSAKFDLAVSVSERRGRNGGGLGIAGVIEYSSDLFDRDQIEVLGARLVRVLEGAVADADRALHLLPILSGSERATILEEWNATARAVSPATLPELFSAQAQRTPGSGCCGLRGSRAELRGAGGACQPAGASPARSWGGA
jgi:non-ribosomal peptide synthetase component F